MSNQWTKKTPECKRSGTGEVIPGCPVHEAGKTPSTPSELARCLALMAPRWRGWQGLEKAVDRLADAYDDMKRQRDEAFRRGARLLEARRILADEKGGE